jgi:hypothetical protein
MKKIEVDEDPEPIFNPKRLLDWLWLLALFLNTFGYLAVTLYTLWKLDLSWWLLLGAVK